MAGSTLLRQSFVKSPSVKLDSEPLTVPALDVGVTPEDKATLADEKSKQKLLPPAVVASAEILLFGINCEPLVPSVNVSQKSETATSPLCID